MEPRPSLHQELCLSSSGHTMQLELTVIASAIPSSSSSVVKGK